MIKPNEKLIYPENGYYDIFGEEIKMPPDAEETLEYIMDTLPQRDADIFMLRYKDGLTYEEIGEKHGGLTRERIRQIIALTLRHIRHPGRNRIILMGREAYLKSIFAANEERKRKYNERIAELEEIIRKQNEEIAAYPDKPDNMEKQGFPVYKISNTISIDVLDLSVRSRNGLIRAGIETIQDLINYDDLFKLRNLGKVSMSEIYHKLKAFILNPYQAILP